MNHPHPNKCRGAPRMPSDRQAPMTIYYPVLTKLRRDRQPRLARLGNQIAELRKKGWTIPQLRTWIGEQIDWLPSERTVYYVLSKKRTKA